MSCWGDASARSGRDYPPHPDLPVLVLPAYQQAERVDKKAAEQGELFG